MSVATSFDRATLLSQKLVIPVRYAAGGEILQTTSTTLSPEAIHVRAERPPRPGLFVGFKLYFDDGEQVARDGVVSWVTAGRNSGFWANFNEEDGNRDQVVALLARHRGSGQGCKRFHTNLAATLRKEGRVSKGQITNISQSGAFLKVPLLPPLGSVIDVDVLVPGQAAPDAVQAFVVHVAPNRGVGIQFIGASDVFRTHLEDYLGGVASPLP